MTRSNQKLKQNSTKVGFFKSRLSAFLRRVRQGEEITIFDRHTPIAKVIPFVQESPLALTTSTAEISGGFKGFKFQPVDVDIDVVSLILEDREDR